MNQKKNMNQNIQIFENRFFESDIPRINALLKQLNPHSREVAWPEVEAILENSIAFALRDLSEEFSNSDSEGLLIGKALLIPSRKFFTFYGTIEDVVVDEKYRGQGLGKLLTNLAIEKGRSLGMAYVDLTSNPKRVIANNLYQSLGFEKRDTNIYRYRIQI